MKPIINVKDLTGPEADPTLVWEAIVAQGIRNRVSDVHVLAQRDGSDLALRLDGDLHFQGLMDPEFSRRLISHVKTLAGIDLGENRRPTEGRMKLPIEGRTIDLRVSAVPTLHGQDLVVRVFDRTVSLRELTELGMMDEQLDYLQDLIQRPHGLILVSGPTGSGKTTTLYAMLRRLTGNGRKIITIENPVEYDLAGVNQTQINPRLGVHFAEMLTAILRQDPDIIMVGEIRDEETARTAVRAATTGHLVLATTHATRASRAVETLLSLGVHPYFLAMTLRAVLAQVLVKRICPSCRRELPETADMIVEPELRERLGDTPARLSAGTGCEACHGSGYAGRLGLFELFVPDEHTKQLILDRRPAEELDQAAARSQMISITAAGRLAALRGETTMEELIDALPMM